MTGQRQWQADFVVIDAFHAMHAGVKVRIYPGTGRQVDPAHLRSPVTWEGDSIGCSDDHLIDLTDQDGNWATIAASDVKAHEVWDRVDAYGRMRIAGAIAFGGAK